LLVPAIIDEPCPQSLVPMPAIIDEL
jgi:hypothetical protein